MKSPRAINWLVGVLVFVLAAWLAGSSSMTNRDFVWSIWFAGLAMFVFVTVATPFFWIPRQNELDYESGEHTSVALYAFMAVVMIALILFGGLQMFFAYPAQSLNNLLPLVPPERLGHGEFSDLRVLVGRTFPEFWPLALLCCASTVPAIFMEMAKAISPYEVIGRLAIAKGMQIGFALVLTAWAYSSDRATENPMLRYFLLALLSLPWMDFIVEKRGEPKPGAAERRARDVRPG